jgi:hypothetical protein
MMDKLTAWLAQYMEQPDKFLHLVIGAAIYATACAALSFAPGASSSHGAVALAAVAGVAWWKEMVYDKERPAAHTNDGWDAYATLLGAVMAALARELILLA